MPGPAGARWRASWNATSAEFRRLNSLERWTEVAQKVRPPLGAMISRVAISQEQVPAPPAGVQVVKFRTHFANKAEAMDTVSLAREGGREVKCSGDLYRVMVGGERMPDWLVGGRPRDYKPPPPRSRRRRAYPWVDSGHWAYARDERERKRMVRGARG